MLKLLVINKDVKIVKKLESYHSLLCEDSSNYHFTASTTERKVTGRLDLDFRH